MSDKEKPIRTRSWTNVYAEFEKILREAEKNALKYLSVNEATDFVLGQATPHVLRISAGIHFLNRQKEALVATLPGEYNFNNRSHTVEVITEKELMLSQFRSIYFHELATLFPSWTGGHVFTLREGGVVVVDQVRIEQRRKIVERQPFNEIELYRFMVEQALSPTVK